MKVTGDIQQEGWCSHVKDSVTSICGRVTHGFTRTRIRARARKTTPAPKSAAKESKKQPHQAGISDPSAIPCREQMKPFGICFALEEFMTWCAGTCMRITNQIRWADGGGCKRDGGARGLEARHARLGAACFVALLRTGQYDGRHAQP